MTRGCLEAVLIQRVLDEPGFWCSPRYGPGGPSLAKHLARRASVWEELGRPGAECLELAAWPPGTPPETIGGAGMVLDRPRVRLAVRWPAP